MGTPPKDATALLAEFVAGTDLARLPPDLPAIARLCLLDTIGAMAAGLRCPGPQAVIAYAGAVSGGAGGSSILGSGLRAPAAMAALANGTMAHTQEIDDVHDESLTHPGAAVVPAALAIAEERGASGAELLCAIILGYELVGRAGLGVGAVRHMLRGFYPTGTAGVFGAAAAAGKLMGLDRDRIVAAFGIAASFAGGVTEYVETGGEVKWLHAGRAAEGGVTAAYLAERGMSAPTTALEGKFGFCRAFGDEPQPERLLEGLGSDFKIRAITVKPYACCSDMHAVIDAVLALRAAHRPEPARIRRVTVEGSTKLVRFNDIDGTRSVMAAKYSVPFTVALALMRDICDPAAYGQATLADPELGAFQRRVQLIASPRFDAIFPKTIAARVELEMEDGTVLHAENFGARGSIHRPLSPDDTRAKFLGLAQPVFGPEGSQEILSRIEALEGIPRIDGLTACLRKAAPPRAQTRRGQNQQERA